MDTELFRQRHLPTHSLNHIGDLVHGGSLGVLSVTINSRPKCADERQPLAFLGMAAPISEDVESSQAAALLRDLITAAKSDRDLTHDKLAELIGVSPGRVSQWATNRGSVPWEKARLVAEILGTKPALISPTFRRLRDDFLASHLSRLDAEIISASQVVAKQVADLAPSQKLSFDRHAESIAKGIQLTLRKAIEISEGSYDEFAQGDGADSRIDRAQGKGEDRREAPAPNRVNRKHSVGAA